MSDPSYIQYNIGNCGLSYLNIHNPNETQDYIAERCREAPKNLVTLVDNHDLESFSTKVVPGMDLVTVGDITLAFYHKGLEEEEKEKEDVQ